MHAHTSPLQLGEQFRGFSQVNERYPLNDVLRVVGKEIKMPLKIIEAAVFIGGKQIAPVPNTFCLIEY